MAGPTHRTRPAEPRRRPDRSTFDTVGSNGRGLAPGHAKHAPCGSDERLPAHVLLITGLLTDEHHLGGGWSPRGDDVRCVLVQLAVAARLLEWRESGELLVHLGHPSAVRCLFSTCASRRA